MAVATPAQLRALLPYLSGTGEDSALAAVIAQADSAVARYLGFPLTAAGACTLESATYHDYPGDGPGRVSGEELRLRLWPVSSITSIHDDQTGGTPAYNAGTLVSSADYTLAGDEGRVFLNPVRTHGTWSRARRAVRVVYVAGWATLPDDLLHAVLVTAKAIYESRVTAGVESVSSSGRSVTMSPSGMPPEALQLAAPFTVGLGL